MGIGLKRSETGGGNPGQKLLMQEAATLFDSDNKAPDSSAQGQGVTDQGRDTLLTLEIDDGALLKRFKRWEDAYKTYFGKIKVRQDNNERYWKGKSFGSAPDTVREYGASDNVIFESFETLLPLVTRENAQPVVNAHGDDDVRAAADTLGEALDELGTQETVKTKMRMSVRHWGIWLLGATKLAWDAQENCVELYNVLPENLALDPNGCFEGGKFVGEWIIEYKSEPASRIIERFPAQQEQILKMAKGEPSTYLKYAEAWTDNFVFWKLGDQVLDKRKNIHWNWDGESNGVNHLKAPSMPYSFVWHFSNGKQPHDETSLMEQSIPLQDVVNKRLRQIDKNADDTNNGWIFNSTFAEESAARALASLRRGGAILAPTPNINEAVTRFPAPALPSFVFEDMADKREQIRNLFGVRGSSAQGISNEQTVRGKIEIKGSDADRVQPIVEQVEQAEAWVYNYMAQMIYVYYTEPMLAKLVGDEKAAKFFAVLQSVPFTAIVTVKEGSTIPQDPLLRRNEAVDLFNAGAIDPVTLFERMDFPNPDETAQRLAAWKMGQIMDGSGQPSVPQAGIPPAGPPPASPGAPLALPPIPPPNPSLVPAV